jgi:hypothetical protein
MLRSVEHKLACAFTLHERFFLISLFPFTAGDFESRSHLNYTCYSSNDII